MFLLYKTHNDWQKFIYISNGPRTKLLQINPLDKACKKQDIAYSKYKNLSDRNTADKVLPEKVWRRDISKNSTANETVGAIVVSNIKKGKVELQMGVKVKLGIKPKPWFSALQK